MGDLPEKILKTTLLIQRLRKTKLSTCRNCTPSYVTAFPVPSTQESLGSDLKPEVTETPDIPPSSEDLLRMRLELVDLLSQHQTSSRRRDQTNKVETEHESFGTDLIF